MKGFSILRKHEKHVDKIDTRSKYIIFYIKRNFLKNSCQYLALYKVDEIKIVLKALGIYQVDLYQHKIKTVTCLTELTKRVQEPYTQINVSAIHCLHCYIMCVAVIYLSLRTDVPKMYEVV